MEEGVGYLVGSIISALGTVAIPIGEGIGNYTRGNNTNSNGQISSRLKGLFKRKSKA